MLVNVVEPFVPGFKAFLPECYNLLAETTPKTTLSIAADTVFLTFFSNKLIITDCVAIFQMSLELFSTIEYFGALINTTPRGLLVTAPSFNLVMSSILMTLPVVLTAKFLRATGKGTAIGASMAFYVLPEYD